MILYKYLISQHLDGQYYYSTDTVTVDETQQPFCNFKFDKPLRLDFLEEDGTNKVVFLFNNELAFSSFGTAMQFRGNIDEQFIELASQRAIYTAENAEIQLDKSEMGDLNKVMERTNPLWHNPSKN